MEKGVSVLICSYNSSERIARTIEHLAAQQFTKPLDWEILFIDNASTDDCSQQALAAWQKYGGQNTGFHILEEKKPGKVYAMNTGIQRARYIYFIVCDDDNRLGPSYIETAYDILESNDQIGAVGGRGILETDGMKTPDWFAQYARHYAVGEQDTYSCDITRRRGYLWGAGMASRTGLYIKLYIEFPSLLMGRKGYELTGGGEDTEYSLRLVLKGWLLFYDSRLVFEHFMPPHRLETTYRDHLVLTQDRDVSLLEKYYLAIKMQRKCSGRPWNTLRLIVVTPFKWLFARSDRKKNLERNKWRYLFAFPEKKDHVLYAIKQFIISGDPPKKN